MVVYAAMTFTPGQSPPTPRGDLFIWPGVGGDIDLFQVVFLTSDNCSAPQGSWCVHPYVAGPQHINGPVTVAGSNDKIRIEYELQPDGVHWIQSATNLATGEVITQLESDSGNYQNDRTYVGWEVRLDKPDTSFQDTFGVIRGATFEGVTMEQNGQVWKIEKIFIPKMS
ncbi:hypothetical protein CHU98_g516 [Xylaria longipes]|nr:hypothetical protein CHU98_g516 [Xylaria longipes]